MKLSISQSKYRIFYHVGDSFILNNQLITLCSPCKWINQVQLWVYHSRPNTENNDNGTISELMNHTESHQHEVWRWAKWWNYWFWIFIHQQLWRTSSSLPALAKKAKEGIQWCKRNTLTVKRAEFSGLPGIIQT